MAHALASLHLVLGAAACAAGFGYVVCSPLLPRAALGMRGLVRAQALQRGLFKFVEPIMRWLAARAAHWPLGYARPRIERVLIRSGSFLGLCADELVALCVLSSAASTLLALAFASRVPLLWTAIALALGALLPVIALQEHKRARDREITRRMPAALDLFALGLNAGLDFSASIELVLSSSVEPKDALRDELTLLAQELAMGRSRMRALRALADRCEVPVVRDFVRAVIQADRKGAPLSFVLETQAEVARNRRSVLAEEAAARASILLLAPLMVMLLALLLVLISPLILRS